MVVHLELMYCRPHAMTASPNVGYECMLRPKPSMSIPFFIARDTSFIISPARVDTIAQSYIAPVPRRQRILTKLAQHIAPAVSYSLLITDDTRQAFSPMLAILSAQHETQYSRLFRS